MQLKNTLLAGAAILAMASGTQNATAKGKNLLSRANMDTTVRPGDNFNLYANGRWLRENPIPKSKTRWGSFNELQENNYNALHTLLEEAAHTRNAKPGSTMQKVGDFYRTGMDSAKIDQIGIASLNSVLTRIRNVKDANGLINEIAIEHTEGIGPLFSFGISPDDKNVTKEVCQFGQGGLGMPGREYYFDMDARTVRIRDAYKAYIPKMLALMGESATAAQKDATDIYNLELMLAGASLTRVEMRDPYKLYNKYSLAEINKLTPGLDWKMLLTSLKVKGEDTVIVGMPAFFTEVAKDMKTVSIETWKKYMEYHLVNNLSSYLSHNFDTTHFAFYGKTMRGQQEQEPRWKRIMQVVDNSEGELLGQMYVDKNFKPEAKKRMLELVNNLQQTYADRINKLDWMSNETKVKAITKLNTFMKKIGYPDKWKDYSSLTIVNNDYIKNVLASGVWEYNYELSKLGRKVDRTEWGMTPPTVNAYYNPGFNEIVFPAGILQYPFFDGDADDAVNYGGIGAVIGHEMTHGFDDQGRLYNAEGNLANWWTSADSANFTMKANMVVDQFNKLIVIDTTHANGALTEGENLADLGGLNIAYEAFKKTEQGKSNTKIDGFTPDQRFFLSWAQVWRANTRPEEIASRLKTDPHSPSELRCNVPITNMQAWYNAFDVKPTDKLFRPASERARVW
ncbi:MAG: putative metalloendopeptidase [Flavipsychrobacter sp.]|nr:putative metalloendopeptidase [Flavipsychrobacter sp.]